MTDTAPWKSDVREGWKVVPLKAVASFFVSNVDKVPSDEEEPVRLCNYTDVYNNDAICPDMGLMQTTASEAEIQRFGLRVDDVVITKDSESWDDIGVPALVVATSDDLVCGYHLAILRPDPRALSGRFLFRCLQSRSIRLHLELSSTGVTRFGLPKEEIGRLQLPVPDLDEQTRIADYLDAETAQIDALVAEKERMLELLEEKRAALVSHAVTRGLNPDAPTKETGIRWVGNIPSHWRIERAKYLLQQAHFPVSEDDEIVTCFRDGEVTLRRNRRLTGFTLADLEVGYQHVRAGDLVLHSMDAFAGAIGVSDSSGKCSPEYVICEPKVEGVCIPYYALLLRVMALRGYILAACPAVRERAPRIRFSQLGDLYLPVPPVDEQEAIVDGLAAERARTAELESALRESIALLKERRAALIAAAVTGNLLDKSFTERDFQRSVS